MSQPPESPLAAALESVGDRWSLLIVEVLLQGPRRFNELIGELPGIAPNVLSQRLKHLEREAIVVSRPYQARPPRLVYQLSAVGTDLAGALRMLAQWGARGSSEATTLRHTACGTPLEARWYCPTCARAVADEEEPEERFV